MDTGNSCLRAAASASTSVAKGAVGETQRLQLVEAGEMGRHIVTAPAAVLEKLPALGVKTAAKLSLNGEGVPRRRRIGGVDAFGHGPACCRVAGLMVVGFVGQ